MHESIGLSQSDGLLNRLIFQPTNFGSSISSQQVLEMLDGICTNNSYTTVNFVSSSNAKTLDIFNNIELCEQGSETDVQKFDNFYFHDDGELIR